MEFKEASLQVKNEINRLQEQQEEEKTKVVDDHRIFSIVIK